MKTRNIQRDPTHSQQIQRWARFVRENPDGWKGKFNEFIDAQFEIARRFYDYLLESEVGRKKLREMERLR